MPQGFAARMSAEGWVPLQQTSVAILNCYAIFPQRSVTVEG